MKKRILPYDARRTLGRVPEPVGFWLCTNKKLLTLKELALALEDITDDVFRYHVNRDKNDFENWIRDIIQDKELAREISRIKTKETLTRKIFERVDMLSKTIKRSRQISKAKRKKVRVKKRRHKIKVRKNAKRHYRKRRRR